MLYRVGLWSSTSHHAASGDHHQKGLFHTNVWGYSHPELSLYLPILLQECAVYWMLYSR